MAPASPNHSDNSSTLFHTSSGDAVTPKDAALPIGSTANGSFIWHSILDTYGKEILKCASDEFLDLATAMRLETIDARDLISLLAQAGRLGYKDTQPGEYSTDDCLTQEVDEDTLSGNSAPTLAGARTDRANDSCFTTSLFAYSTTRAETPEDIRTRSS